uniref:Uncharacterized protein n=1 Tax=Arundo donax TaxID=35708 RepID=A0A0A9AZT6_ARUDO
MTRMCSVEIQNDEQIKNTPDTKYAAKY